MHELNHDMEDLFRRAAESYPLKTTSNWESINSKLDLVSRETKQDKNKKRRFLFLFFFLSLAAGTYITIDQPVPAERNQKANTTILESSADKQPGSLRQTRSTQKENRQLFTENDKTSRQTETIYPINETGKINDAQFLVEHKNNTRKISRQIFPNPFVQNNITEEPDLSHKLNPLPGSLNEYPRFSVQDFSITSSPVIQQPKTDGLSKPAPQIAKQQPILKRQQKIYFGLTAGPAINTVKSFSPRWAFKGGLFTGLPFDNQFSIEAGLIYTKNYYEAKSNHFDAKGIAPMLTGGRQLNEVHGSNQVIELPLTLRYQFSSRNKSFFAGAGISSHLMTRESNWYLTSLNGNNEMLYGNYDDKKLYFASAITITTGYQAQLGKKNMIRVEPYVQLPLKGTGIGKIKLLSTGINLSLSRTTQ